MPASLSRFIASLTKKAVCTGSAESLDLIYILLKAGSGSSSARLAISPLADLQQQLLEYLRRSDDTILQYLGFLALIQEELRRNAELAIKPAPGEDPEDAVNKSFPKHDYFTKKAHKTLDFVVLKVIVAFSEDDKAADVKVAIDVMNAIRATMRSSWLEKKPATVRKVCEKVRRPGLDPQTKLWVSPNLPFLGSIGDRWLSMHQGLEFITLLLSGKPLPRTVVGTFAELVVSSPSLDLSPNIMNNFTVSFRPLAFLLSV